jgi:hypothetical protein
MMGASLRGVERDLKLDGFIQLVTHIKEGDRSNNNNKKLRKKDTRRLKNEEQKRVRDRNLTLDPFGVIVKEGEGK